MARLVVGLLALPWLTFALVAADEPKPKFEMSKEEQAIFEATNKERAKENLPALEPNATLFKVARAHSANMAKKGEMNHVLDCKTPADRVKAAGYEFMEVGENIAQGTKESPDAIMKLWMGSKLHKENILGKDFKEIGIGLVKNDKGEVYYTQVFGTQLKK